jgi:hypothetical protein
MLSSSGSVEVEWDVQSWPERALQERANLDVLLVGISSSHTRAWSYKDRSAPERCRADAWVYVPGKALIVFECKNDNHPLDATQMCVYACELGLFSNDGAISRPCVGSTLSSADEGVKVENACKEFVLDAPWSSVVSALSQIVQAEGTVDWRGRWLCEQAIQYLDAHNRPLYEGPVTILEWLKGTNSQRRLGHLRELVRSMGRCLGECGGMTFATDADGKVDVRHGAGAACYVSLKYNGKPPTREIAAKAVSPVLWFDFAEAGSNAPQVGLEYYLQASGSCTESRSRAEWNKASKRHAECARRFEAELDAWVRNHDWPNARVHVEAVCFRGKKRNWMGGGATCREAPASGPVSPQEALQFLRDHRDELWQFPTVETDGATAIEKAAKGVRKPAISLILPISRAALIECGADTTKIQRVLEQALRGE